MNMGGREDVLERGREGKKGSDDKVVGQDV